MHKVSMKCYYIFANLNKGRKASYELKQEVWISISLLDFAQVQLAETLPASIWQTQYQPVIQTHISIKSFIFSYIIQIPHAINSSSCPEVFLRKSVLKICSKRTGEHPCWEVILIKLPSNFIKITFQHGCSPVILLHVFRTPFPKNTSRWLLLYQASISRSNLCKVFQSKYKLTYHTQRWGILKTQHCDLINYKHHFSIRYFYLTTKLHCLKINQNRWNAPLF